MHGEMNSFINNLLQKNKATTELKKSVIDFHNEKIDTSKNVIQKYKSVQVDLSRQNDLTSDSKNYSEVRSPPLKFSPRRMDSKIQKSYSGNKISNIKISSSIEKSSVSPERIIEISSSK
jgi:hypothetical protein